MLPFLSTIHLRRACQSVVTSEAVKRLMIYPVHIDLSIAAGCPSASKRDLAQEYVTNALPLNEQILVCQFPAKNVLSR